VIYFAQLDSGTIKIGTTDNVDVRIRALESRYGKPAALLATMPGGPDDEAAIHERFAHLRFGRTEQFRPAAELMEFIGKPLLVHPDPDAVEVTEKRADIITLGYLVSAPYLEWITRAAKVNRSSISGLIDQAVAKYAQEIGVAETPPDRTA